MKHRILFVDDEPANLRMLERLFRDDYDVMTAPSGFEALDILKQYEIELIVTDQRMPGMTGIEFLKQATKLRPQSVRIVLTGYTDVGDLVEAVNSGVVYRYITKPWINADLKQTVLSATRHYDTNKGQHLLLQENKRLNDRLRVTVDGFVHTVVEVIGHRNNHLAEHCQRTANYAAIIGEKFNLGAKDMKQLALASSLHEVPNLWLPFDMGIDRSALTKDQFQMTRSRFETGLKLITIIPDLEEVANILMYQHEHYDGSGFFAGLDGERIPLKSRILAIASALDDYSSRNFSTGAKSADPPTVWLKKHAHIEFDPMIIQACLSSDFIQPMNLVNNVPVSMQPQFGAVDVSHG